MNNPYRYAVEFVAGDSDVLGQEWLDVHWAPAIECARFNSFRERRATVRTDDDNDDDNRWRATETQIRPTPHPESGFPRCDGFRVTVKSGDERVEEAFSNDFFSDAADQVQARVIKARGLPPETAVNRRFMVYPIESAPRGEDKDAASDRLEVQDRFPTVELLTGERALQTGWQNVGPVNPADIRVRIPRGVLAEADAQASRVGAVETGGVLIGRLVSEPGGTDVDAEIGAMIPARDEGNAPTHMTITPETWAEVHDMIKLRGGGEIILGWWHSHPAKDWCSPQCPPERRRTCPVMTPFFSQVDRRAHATAFSAAFQTAFVLTLTDEGIRHNCYGWRRGVIRERGFTEC